MDRICCGPVSSRISSTAFSRSGSTSSRNPETTCQGFASPPSRFLRFSTSNSRSIEVAIHHRGVLRRRVVEATIAKARKHSGRPRRALVKRGPATGRRGAFARLPGEDQPDVRDELVRRAENIIQKKRCSSAVPCDHNFEEQLPRFSLGM